MNSRPRTTQGKVLNKNQNRRAVPRMRLLRISFARQSIAAVWKALVGTPYPARGRCAREGAASPAMEFPSCYDSSDLLWNSIAVERVCRGSAPGRARQAAAMDGGHGGSAPGRARQAAAMDGGHGGSAPGRARQAVAMDGGRGGGACHGALHGLLWNSRAATALQICYGIP
jgi:hypothetical protein